MVAKLRKIDSLIKLISYLCSHKKIIQKVHLISYIFYFKLVREFLHTLYVAVFVYGVSFLYEKVQLQSAYQLNQFVLSAIKFLGINLSKAVIFLHIELEGKTFFAKLLSCKREYELLFY